MRTKIIIGLGALAVAAVVAVIWLMPMKQRAGPWILPDGSELSLAGVTYGKNHAMRYGNGIADYLYPILSRALRQKLGCKVTTFQTPDTNAIVVWFWQKGPNTAGGIGWPPYYLATADENGIEAEVPFTYTSAVWQKTNILKGLVLKPRPHRAKEIGIRIRQFNDPSRLIAEFKIPNRTATKYPVWAANPLPVTVKTNDLEISLVALETGFNQRGSKSGTRARFKFTKNQELSDEWIIRKVSARSATGEGCGSILYSEFHDAEKMIPVVFSAPLWPEEPAWKLSVELVRTTNYPATECWTVKGVPVPGEGETRQMNVTTNILGSEIELLAVSGGSLNTNTATRRAYRTVVAHLRSPVGVPEARLRLAEAADGQARKMEFKMDHESPSNSGKGTPYRWFDKDYIIYVPEDDGNMNLTLAYTKSVFVEFLARATMTTAGK